MDNNLLESNGTSKVFGNEKEREKTIASTHVIGYITPLTLAMYICFGWVVLEKSQGSNVMWSVAPESIIQPSWFPILE